MIRVCEYIPSIKSFGPDSVAMTNSISEVETMGPKDVIFAVGTNTTECHPILGVYMLEAKSRGAKLIVADPRETDIARQADIWLKLLS